MSGCCRAEYIAARGNGGDLVGEEEEEGCVMRQKDGLREALHKDRDADHGMARSRDSTLGRRGRRYSSSVQSRLDGSVCMMIEPQEPWTKITSQIACLRRPVYVRLAYTAYAASCRPHRRPDMWPVVACMRVAPSQCRVCGTSTGTACLVQGAILRTKTAATSSTQRSWPPHSQTRSRRPAEAFCFALTGVETERDAPCSQPSTPKLAYVNASFVIPLYTALVYHACMFAQVMTCNAQPGELFSDVCLSVLSASIKRGICSCPHARMENNEKAKPTTAQHH